MKDITERKEAEEIKGSQERLKLLFEYAPDAYYLSDLKGTFIDGNIAAERMLGYKREKLKGTIPDEQDEHQENTHNRR